MKNSGQIFGTAFISLWIGLLFATFLPIKNNSTHAAIIAISFFVIAFILGNLFEKNKLF